MRRRRSPWWPRLRGDTAPPFWVAVGKAEQGVDPAEAVVSTPLPAKRKRRTPKRYGEERFPSSRGRLAICLLTFDLDGVEPPLEGPSLARKI